MKVAIILLLATLTSGCAVSKQHQMPKPQPRLDCIDKTLVKNTVCKATNKRDWYLCNQVVEIHASCIKYQ